MNGKILSIDLGRIRCGLAISNEGNTISRPLKIIQRKDLYDEINNILITENVELIIVGQPGINTTIGISYAKIASKIKRRFKIKTLLVDETLSTMSARKINSKKKRIDDIAAAVILQDYLYYNKNMKGNNE